MTGADKYNKYYLVTAAEYEKKQTKPPPFTHKGIQNARIAQAYENVRDAQENTSGKTIYQAMTELEREVKQLTPRQPLYQDPRPQRSPERRYVRDQREQSRSISPVRQQRHEPRHRKRNIDISPVQYHEFMDNEPVDTPQTDYTKPTDQLAPLRGSIRTYRRRHPSPLDDDAILTMFSEDDVVRPDRYNKKRKTTPLKVRDTHRVGPPRDAHKRRRNPPTRLGNQELNDLLDTGVETRRTITGQTKSNLLRDEKIAADIAKKKEKEKAEARGRGRGRGRGEWTPY